jgi:hypothetical protein
LHLPRHERRHVGKREQGRAGTAQHALPESRLFFRC